MEERRSSQRHDLGIKVFDEGGNLLGWTKNISLEGCSFVSRPNIKMGDILNIYFELPGAQTKVKAQCFVKWRANKGLGAAFSMTAQNRKIYLQFIKPWNVVTS